MKRVSHTVMADGGGRFKNRAPGLHAIQNPAAAFPPSQQNENAPGNQFPSSGTHVNLPSSGTWMRAYPVQPSGNMSGTR